MLVLQTLTSSLLAVILVFTANVSVVNANSRIFGGVPVTIDRAPYTVQLRYYGQSAYCGGALVSSRYVVTAAHCVSNPVNPKDVVVVGGVSTKTEAAMERKIEKIMRHPDYSTTTYHSDIAVLKLDGDMKGNNIKTLPLCTRPLKTGDLLEIWGWGQISDRGQSTQQLRTATVPIISKEKCSLHYGPYVAKNMMCAHVPGLKDSCKGDSGGPAVNRGELCGVVSFGYGCGRGESSGTYADVYAVRGFLEKSMRA